MISGDYSARMTNYNIMNQIISSFGDDGGVIYLPKGTYYLAGFIQWKSKVCLYGDGMGQTIFKPTFNMAFKGDHLTDFEMHSFTIDGDENSDPNAGKGIFFSYLHNVTFRDIEIKNTKESGFGCDHFQNGVLDNIRCDNCGTKGNLETGVAYGCSGLGIGVGCWKHGKEGLTITNCHVNNCIQNGAFFERQTPTGNYGDFPVGISVIGCTAEGNRNGFGVSGCDSITFIGCTAYKNHHAGFSYDNGTMNGLEQYGMRPKFIGCIAKENGKSIPDGYPEYNSESNGHGFVVTNNYRGIEMISCNALDNSKNGLFIANSYLDDFKKNAGYNNYTKFARDVNSWGQPGCQGQPWCAEYQFWKLVKVIGITNALKIMGGGFYNCVSITNWAKKKGTWRNAPKVGALVIFRNGSHVGSVQSFDSSRIYTNEGNTSSAAGVVANGGAVRNKSYAIDDSSIDGYVWIDWESYEDTATWKKTGIRTATVNDLYVRETPNGYIMGSINKGTVVEIDGKTSEKWTHVKVSGIGIGWIWTGYLTEKANSESSTITDKQNKSQVLFKGNVTATVLNVRTWAGTEYPNIKKYPTLNQGNEVEVMNFTQKDKNGSKWYYIRIAGKYYGFVSAKYVKKQ